MDLYSYDQSLSTVNKVQREYWMAKQVLKKRLGKTEDQHVIAGDNDIDCKLSQYKSIQDTCVRLLKELEKYHSCVCMLARDENNLGRFLKDQGAQDSTKAGKMMIAVGKALCYSAQQRLQLRHPMSRLREDIETFRVRAIKDTSTSVEKMEIERSHYRASLLWMQNISENLDPEQYSKLEKFKKVQKEVRINKEKFDHRKWAVCQKIDLLSASRSNLFSNTLAPYQNELLNFWERTAKNMAAVLESFKGYQHYEFKLLKDLNPIQLSEDSETTADLSGIKDEGDDRRDALIDFDNRDEEFDENPFEDAMDALGLDDDNTAQNDAGSVQQSKDADLLGIANNDSTPGGNDDEVDLWNDILDDRQDGGDFENQWKSAFGDFVSANPLEEQPPPSNSEAEKDILSFLKPSGKNQQPVAPSTTDDSKGFMPSHLLDMHFMRPTGPVPPQQMPMPPAYNTLSNLPPVNPSSFYSPQQPLQQMPTFHASGSTFQPTMPQAGASVSNQQNPSKQSSKGKADWYNLFAELDPLQNPDALGKKEKTDEDGRAC